MAGIAGVLLAGGLGQRMGGVDKCLQRISGFSLLERALTRAGSQVDMLLLNVNGDPSRFPLYHLPVVADTLPGYPGPLAGILAALEYLRDNEPAFHLLASFPSDTPWFPCDFVSCCVEAIDSEQTEMAVASSAGRRHPVFGVWPVSCAALMRQSLIDEERKIDRFTARFRLSVVDWQSEPVDPFFNINTPEDLARAEDLAAQMDADSRDT